MITCTLGEKKYTVDYITGRALREMEPAAKMYAKIVAVANAAAKGEDRAGRAAVHHPRGHGRDDPLVLPAVRRPVHRGRGARPLPRRPAHARRGAGASCRADADPPASSTIFLRPPAATQAEKNPPDAARNSSIPPTTRCSRAAGTWTRSTAWTCPASSASVHGRPTTKEAHSAPAPLHRRGLAQYETLIPTHQGR